jgi:hypothetical protein
MLYDVSKLHADTQAQIAASLDAGRAMWRQFPDKLLGVGNDAKTVKGDKVTGPNGERYRTAILYLAPADMSGVNVCPLAELAVCKDPCLNTAGRGRMSSVQMARLRKTLYFHQYRGHFMAQLYREIEALREQCRQEGVQLCVRLNGTSDIMWEVHGVYVTGYSEGMNGETLDPAQPYWLGGNLMQYFPDVQFYDYTKIAKRGPQPEPNYDLTFSNSDASDMFRRHVEAAAKAGFRFATVVRDEATKQQWAEDASLPTNPYTAPVFDGDKHDLTFLRPQGANLLLTAKGNAKTDTSGFVFD